MIITKQDFLDYISSFGKQPGEFTEEEIFDIAVAHRSLSKKDKDWEELVKLLGINKTGEQFRKSISKMVHSDKEQEQKSKVSFEELFIQQQKTRDEWTAYKRILREDARIESLKDAISSVATSLTTLPKVTYPKTTATSTEAILMISDVHMGVDCNSYCNVYNPLIAEARLNKLVDDAIRYCKVNKVETLNVVNLGDMIHGIIHVSARIDSTLDVVEQVMRVSEVLSNCLNKLQAAAPNIIYRSCTDNHSRAMANKGEAIEKENFGRLIDWYLESRLSKTKIVFANDNLDVDLGKFYLKNGKAVVFSHGHNDSINQAFQHFVGATEEFIHYMLLGHYHCEKAKSYQNSKVFVNGSVVGTEQYAGSKRLFSKPSQTLLVFDNDNIINYSINLDINTYETE